MVEKDGRNKEKGHSSINVEIKLQPSGTFILETSRERNTFPKCFKENTLSPFAKPHNNGAIG